MRSRLVIAVFALCAACKDTSLAPLPFTPNKGTVVLNGFGQQGLTLVPDTGTLTSFISLPATFDGASLRITRDTALTTASKGGGDVLYVVDLVTGSKKPIQLPAASNPAGAALVVGRPEASVVVALRDSQAIAFVTNLGSATPTVTLRRNVGQCPVDVVQFDTELWVLDANQNCRTNFSTVGPSRLLRLRFANAVIDTFPLGASVIGASNMQMQGANLYIGGFGQVNFGTGVVSQAGTIIKFDLEGGTIRQVAPVPPGAFGTVVAPGRDGFVYASARARLYRVRVPGGATTAISTINAATHEDRHVSPTLLPNGRGVLFTIQYVPNSNIDLYEVAVLDIASGKHHVLMKGVAARFTNDRIVVVRANGELVSTPFDQEKLIVTGPPVIVQTGVAVEGTFGTVSIAIADDGTLAYMPGLSVGGSASLTWVSRSGAESPVDTGWKADFRSASLSPDGKRMAATIADQTHEDVWIKELATGPQAKAKITLDRGLHQRASWSADGQRVLFLDATTFPSVLKSARTDGIGRAELVAGESRSISQGFASADGKWIFYRTSSSSMGHGDILARRVGDSVSVPLLATDADERHPSLSPNGKWLAYRSDESGRSEVYVRPFPDVNQRKWLVSTAGGTDPVWGRSGKELFFINNANEMIAAAVETGTTFSVRGLSRLFALPTGIRSYVSSQRFDVSMDDSRFLMIRSENTGARSRDQLMYVTNWFTELRALTDKAKR